MRQTGQRQRQRPVTENNLECPMPRERTDFWAGSVEKVEIMRHRLEAGEHLHHPYDCKQIIVDEQDPVTHANTFYKNQFSTAIDKSIEFQDDKQV